MAHGRGGGGMRTAPVSDVIANFQPARRFGSRKDERPYSVTSLDFDDTGEYCIVARDDETLQMYNCKTGTHAKELKSQKYGVDLARFTHHNQSIIYASTKIDDTIRYLSAHDNTYIRYFRGHTAPVTTLALSPSSDTFISASLDDTVRLWDLRSQNPQYQLSLKSPYLAAYDPGAVVLAVATVAAQAIMLYDARQIDGQPFATFDMREHEARFAHGRAQSGGNNAAATAHHAQGDWTKLEFSNDGKKLLVATSGPGHYVLDAFDGPLIAYLPKTNGGTSRIPPSVRARIAPVTPVTPSQSSRTGNGNVTGTGDACFSPDGRYVVGGSGDAGMLVWDLDLVSGQEDVDMLGSSNSSSKNRKSGKVWDEREKVLLPSHTIGEDRKDAGTANVVGYNPRHNLITSADRGVVFWVPDME